MMKSFKNAAEQDMTQVVSPSEPSEASEPDLYSHSSLEAALEGRFYGRP